MFRKHENPDAFKAGLLAIAVHAALLVAMLISVDWKAVHLAQNVTEVEFWDKLPSATIAPPKSTPKPVEKPEPPQPEPKSQPEPLKAEPKPDPKIEDEKQAKLEAEQAEIALEKKKQEKLEQTREKEKIEKAEKEKLEKEKLEKLKQEAREEQLKEKKAAEKAEKEALKKFQQEMLNDENTAGEKQANAASAAANASVVNQYIAQISAKIKSRINNTSCQDGNPVVKFRIDVLPTGELSGNPKLTKSSGSATCDDAVERAILASVPLPLPDERALKAEFRNLNLIIKPND